MMPTIILFRNGSILIQVLLVINIRMRRTTSLIISNLWVGKQWQVRSTTLLPFATSTIRHSSTGHASLASTTFLPWACSHARKMLEVVSFLPIVKTGLSVLPITMMVAISSSTMVLTTDQRSLARIIASLSSIQVLLVGLLLRRNS